MKKKEIDVKGVNEVIDIAKKILNILYVVMVVGIIFLGTLLIKEWGILTFVLTILKVATPFFIGFVIAWLFNPLVCQLEKKGLRRGFATVIVYIVFLVLLFSFFYLLIPTIYRQINELISSLPSIFTSVEEWLNNIFNNFNNVDFIDYNKIEENILNSIKEFGNGITENLPTLLMNSIGAIFSGLGTLAISLVVGLYMLLDFNGITDHLMKFIPKTHKFEIRTLIENIGEELRKCVHGTLFVAICVGIFDSIGFMFVGLQAPVLFGILCGITDLIPYIGPYIGGIAAVIVGFSQSYVIGIIVIVIVVVVQLLENNVLQPLVMSKTMKLHPVTIMIGLLIFGNFFGIVGMVLATPTIALVKVIYRFFASKYDWFNSDLF